MSHILVYPFPGPGHIIPFIDLTGRLLARGLTVTVLLTPPHLPLLDPLLSLYPSSQLLPLAIPAPPTPPLTLLSVMHALHQYHYPALLSWFQSHPSPPVAILSDFFLGWTHHLACRVGVPRLVFSPSGAMAFSVLASLWRDMPQNGNPIDTELVVSFPSIPNSPKFPWWQLSPLFRTFKKGDADSEFLRENHLVNLESWGIVINSFADLENVYLDHMKALFGKDRVWAVGPILPSNEESARLANRGGGASSVSCEEVLTWLDGKRDDSVIYVCFGSRGVLTRQQMEVLAAALDKSRVSFIWCIREPKQNHAPGQDDDDDYGVLGDDYEDGVRGRGMIIKGWAPQVAILKHSAVGAFLTHCGWNSVVEGIEAGAVLLTWPLGADQFSNAKLAVDELGVGIRVGEDTQKIPTAAELASILARSVVEENLVERSKVKKLQAAAFRAVNGGSSDQDLDAFVNTINHLKKTV